jgi:predicted glycosyltransferase
VTPDERPLRAWVDIENPPQVQYLVPLVRAFERRGAEVFVTARDYGITLELLRDSNIEFTPVGRHFGAGKRAKVVGTAKRIRDLRVLLANRPRRDLVVSASRSASLAARSLGVPPFALCDYEHVNLFAFRLAGARIVHPDVIADESFVARGVRRDRLIEYRGIKEDITFADVDVDAIVPHVFPGLDGSGRLKVLVRPPAEESHYHRAESSELGRRALMRFAADERIAVIFSPRYEWQADALASLDWKVAPVVLTEPVPFVSLLGAVDVVVSGGGTMTREAAYLGVPAVSLFQGNIGDVDRYLESINRLAVIRSAEALAAFDFHDLTRRDALAGNRAAADDVVDAVSRVAVSARMSS